ncbi:MAG: hypothetical protein IIA87_00465 [Nanoarchaeota archaeon]|nr:hypothetical protein [Nanoarchaeota archaeon]
MRTKKGQIGQIITSLPVIILVFILMLVFVIVSAAVFGVKGDTVKSEPSLSSSLLLKEIEIDGENIFVFDAIKNFGVIYSKEGVEKKDIFEKELMKLVDENKDCLVLFKTDKRKDILSALRKENFYSTSLFIMEYIDEEAVRSSILSWTDAEDKLRYLGNKFGWPGSFNEVSYVKDEKRFFIYSYYGRCKNGATNE